MLWAENSVANAALFFFMGSRARENMERSGIFSQETTRYAGGGQGLIAKKLSSEAIQ